LSLIVNTYHAGILLENMWWEGFELSVSPPAVM
jgi:predicted membrane GTPase involved in stress response